MSNSTTHTAALEQKILALQEEVGLLRKNNIDLNEHIKAYSSVSVGQTSLINKLIDKVPFGVMLVDEKYCVTHANEEAEKIFSMSVSQLKGLNCPDLFGTSTVTSENIGVKNITLLENGKYVMFSTFVRDEGSNTSFVKSFVDISEIKLAEQELIKVSQTKDEFLGMISHELRTPLNVIQGYSSLLEDEMRSINNTDAILYVEHINEAGNNLLHVVANLLELSDLTAGKVNVDAIPISIEIIITQLQYRLEKKIANEGNELIFKSDDILPFEQDLALLMKTLYELLINANKFTEKGTITVAISLQKKRKDNYLCFEVSDTGCGMTEETMRKVFHAFHQADSSMARAYDGLGLGLSLVEKMVKILKGNIEVISEVGKGSTFTLQVPYQEVSDT